MIRLLLIEGQTSERTALRRDFALHNDVTLIGEAGDFRTACKELERDDYDAVLLAAALPGGEVFDLLPKVRQRARLIFITGIEEPAVPLLEAAKAEYWLKPLTPQRTARLIDRLRMPPPQSPRPVPVKVGRFTRLEQAKHIRIVLARQNYSEATLASGERLLVRRTLHHWSQLLPSPQFARVHRGLFLNLDHVIRTERGTKHSTKLHFAGGLPAPLAVKRRHWPKLRLRLERWRASEATRSSVPSKKAIVILPFFNLSGHIAPEYFCDGITDELINVLVKVQRLRVAARTSAFSFKGKSLPISQIAEQLGVDFVVEGGVRLSGNRVRTSVKLINGADGLHAWSHTFEREFSDLLAAQEDIANEVAATLHAKLGEEGPGFGADPAVHWLTIEGRHFWSLRTCEAFARAEAVYNKAIALDPRHAPAQAGIADVFVLRAMYRLCDGASDATEDLQRGRRAAQLALELDSMLGEPRTTLGFALFHEGNLPAAAREIYQALALTPTSAAAYQVSACTLCSQGRMERGLAEHQNSVARDPVSSVNIERYATMLALAGRTREALAANERAATLRRDIFVGNLAHRALLLLALGRKDEAVAVARAVRTTGRNFPYRCDSDANAIFVLHQAGHSEEAADYADEFLSVLPSDNYLRGFILSAVGRFTDAYPHLERTPTIMLPFLYWSAMWEPARGTVEFHTLMARLGREVEYATARAEWEVQCAAS